MSNRIGERRAGGGRTDLAVDLDLDAGLARLGYEQFRRGQREAIETLLSAGRLLARRAHRRRQEPGRTSFPPRSCQGRRSSFRRSSR